MEIQVVHQKMVYKDANSAKVWLNKNGVKDKDIILWRVFGTAIAIHLAQMKNFQGLF